jgi:hypothetical protein
MIHYLIREILSHADLISLFNNIPKKKRKTEILIHKTLLKDENKQKEKDQSK